MSLDLVDASVVWLAVCSAPTTTNGSVSSSDVMSSTLTDIVKSNLVEQQYHSQNNMKQSPSSSIFKSLLPLEIYQQGEVFHTPHEVRSRVYLPVADLVNGLIPASSMESSGGQDAEALPSRKLRNERRKLRILHLTAHFVTPLFSHFRVAALKNIFSVLQNSSQHLAKIDHASISLQSFFQLETELQASLDFLLNTTGEQSTFGGYNLEDQSFCELLQERVRLDRYQNEQIFVETAYLSTIALPDIQFYEYLSTRLFNETLTRFFESRNRIWKNNAEFSNYLRCGNPHRSSSSYSYSFSEQDSDPMEVRGGTRQKMHAAVSILEAGCKATTAQFLKTLLGCLHGADSKIVMEVFNKTCLPIVMTQGGQSYHQATNNRSIDRYVAVAFLDLLVGFPVPVLLSVQGVAAAEKLMSFQFLSGGSAVNDETVPLDLEVTPSPLDFYCYTLASCVVRLKHLVPGVRTDSAHAAALNAKAGYNNHEISSYSPSPNRPSSSGQHDVHTSPHNDHGGGNFYTSLMKEAQLASQSPPNKQHPQQPQVEFFPASPKVNLVGSSPPPASQLTCTPPQPQDFGPPLSTPSAAAFISRPHGIEMFQGTVKSRYPSSHINSSPVPVPTSTPPPVTSVTSQPYAMFASPTRQYCVAQGHPNVMQIEEDSWSSKNKDKNANAIPLEALQSMVSTFPHRPKGAGSVRHVRTTDWPSDANHQEETVSRLEFDHNGQLVAQCTPHRQKTTITTIFPSNLKKMGSPGRNMNASHHPSSMTTTLVTTKIRNSATSRHGNQHLSDAFRGATMIEQESDFKQLVASGGGRRFQEGAMMGSMPLQAQDYFSPSHSPTTTHQIAPTASFYPRLGGGLNFEQQQAQFEGLPPHGVGYPHNASPVPTPYGLPYNPTLTHEGQIQISGSLQKDYYSASPQRPGTTEEWWESQMQEAESDLLNEMQQRKFAPFQ